MTDKASNQQNFINILTELVVYVQKNIPVVAEKAKVVGFKLEAAVDLAPAMLCTEFVKKLKPFAMQLINRDESFFLNHGKEIPIVKDINLELEWANLSETVQNEIWKRVNSAFTFATLASHESASNTQKSLAGGIEGLKDIDPSQLGETVQNLMPAVMQMMGPMLQSFQGAAGGGPAKTTGGAQKASQLNSPMMQMLQGFMGGGTQMPSNLTPVKELNRPADYQNRKEMMKQRLRNKLKERQAKSAQIEEEESDPTSEDSDQPTPAMKPNIRDLL